MQNSKLSFLLIVVATLEALIFWEQNAQIQKDSAFLDAATKLSALRIQVSDLKTKRSDHKAYLSAAKQLEPETTFTGTLATIDLSDAAQAKVKRADVLRKSNENQHLQNAIQRLNVRIRYGMLFERLHLSPGKVRELETLIIDSENIASDVTHIVTEHSFGERDTLTSTGGLRCGEGNNGR